MTYSIADALSQSIPLAGSVQISRDTEVGEHQAGFTMDAHGAFTGRLSIYISDVSGVSVGDQTPDLETLFTPALEAAAAAAGATATAIAEHTEPGDNAEIFRIDYQESNTVVWLAIETVEVEATLSYDPTEVRRIENVKLDISVVVGKTTMTIAELLSLKPGQVVDLDRAAGSPVDVLVNGEHVAAGEVVVLDQDYGVKINRVIRMPKVN